MGKMRNYVYGSPKFEGDINKAISEAGGDVKIYRHHVYIIARDANYTNYPFEIMLYSTDATPIFNLQQIPTIADVVAFITPFLDVNSQTPAYINGGVEYHFEKVTDGIEGTSLTYNTAEEGRSAITNIMGAADIVVEV